MATTDDLLDLRDIGQRAESFRFDLLDHDLNRIGEIHPDRTPTPPTITNDMGRAVKRSLANLRMSPGTYDDVNTKTHRIRVAQVMENGDVLPWGVFVFSDDPTEIRSSGSSLVTQLVDQGMILNQPTTDYYQLGYMASIRSALRDLFESQNLRYQIAISDQARIGEAGYVKPPGTSKLSIMQELCRLAGAYDPWFDNDGIGQISPVVDLNDAPVAIRYEPGLNIADQTIVVSDGLITAPNQWVVVDTGPTSSGIRGVYNVPASTPNSYQQIGYYRPRVINVQGLQNSTAAAEAARATAYQDLLSYQWASLAGIVDARLDTFQVVTFDEVRYRIQRWGSVDLRPGATVPMSLRRVYSDVVG